MDTSGNAPAEVRKYTYEDILTLMGGFNYFAEEQIQYVYHKSNGNNEEAAHYLAICREHAAELQNKADRMKDAKEVETLEPSSSSSYSCEMISEQ